MTSPHTDALTFVLVHGAWHGGWCWSRTAHILRQQGHTVFTPTQTGLGERSHLLGPGITLDTFVQDIIKVLDYENLHNVILVGHSFGGLTITGVADQRAARIAQLVYLDAFILGSGISTFDTLPAAVIDKMTAAAHALNPQAPAVPAPKPASLGLSRPEDLEFMTGRLTPQPLGVYETSLTLEHPVGNGLPATYIQCTDPVFSAVQGSFEWVKAHTDWKVEQLATGHDAMVSAPEELARLLVRVASASC